MRQIENPTRGDQIARLLQSELDSNTLQLIESTLPAGYDLATFIDDHIPEPVALSMPVFGATNCSDRTSNLYLKALQDKLGINASGTMLSPTPSTVSDESSGFNMDILRVINDYETHPDNRLSGLRNQIRGFDPSQIDKESLPIGLQRIYNFLCDYLKYLQKVIITRKADWETRDNLKVDIAEIINDLTQDDLEHPAALELLYYVALYIQKNFGCSRDSEEMYKFCAAQVIFLELISKKTNISLPVHNRPLTLIEASAVHATFDGAIRICRDITYAGSVCTVYYSDIDPNGEVTEGSYSWDQSPKGKHFV